MLYEIYGTSNCSFCHKAEELLTTHNKTYTFIDVSQNKNVMAAFLSRFPGVTKVPQVVLGDEHIGGYEQLRKRLTYDQIESIL